MPGTLYLVATPIGNLQDITLRAIDVLRSVDVIACEDTRHTRNLLTHLRISNRLLSYHEHNEAERAEELIDRLMLGENVGIVSDAGTPGISDPGFRIVARAIESGVAVVPVPGPAAFVSAVIASGLATDSIFFGGFLPSKKGERRKRLTEVADIPATLVFYEAPHRIMKALADCAEVLGDRQAVVARELTKVHEEFVRGTLFELVDGVEDVVTKGEMVLIIARASSVDRPSSREITLQARFDALLAEGLGEKAALKAAAKEFGIGRSEAYRRLKIER
jgi:16S rRNA (cytidine1402-2'-O)-methyltransferase